MTMITIVSYRSFYNEHDGDDDGDDDADDDDDSDVMMMVMDAFLYSANLSS